MKFLRLPLITVWITLAIAPLSADELQTFEVRPQHLVDRAEERDQHLKAVLPPPQGPLRFILDYTKTWLPGETVRVAFRGGSQELRERIEIIASEWTEHANIELSFRDEQGHFREWIAGQKRLTAEIRIGFDCTQLHCQCGGYWSTVGTDAIHPEIAGPGEPTMNLQDFDNEFPEEDGVGTVLHEFGHALGFLHEHQRPLTGCYGEFRWDDDPGYQDKLVNGQYVKNGTLRPGLRKWLKGAPNKWSDAQIKTNFANLESDSSAYDPSAKFDRDSIMKYAFPRWMYLDEARLECYSPIGNSLSDGDQAGAKKHYPESRFRQRSVLEKRLKFLRRALSAEDLDLTYWEFYDKRRAKVECFLRALNTPTGP